MNATKLIAIETKIFSLVDVISLIPPTFKVCLRMSTSATKIQSRTTCNFVAHRKALNFAIEICYLNGAN